MEVIFLTTVVSAPYYSVFRSIGSYQLAWLLRREGYQVQVIDFLYFFTNEKILCLLEHYVTEDTRIIGLGGIGVHGGGGDQFYVRMAELLGEIRQRWPWIRFIGGGGGAPSILRLMPPKLLDYLVFGFAEQTMLDLAHHYVRGGPRPNSEITATGQQIIRADLQPQRWQINGDLQHQWHPSDHIQPGECLPIEHSRGCVFKCRFCSYPLLGKKKQDHLKRLECLEHQLRANYEQWGTRLYYILDDTFNVDHQRVKDFRAMTDRLGFDIGYSAYLRLDLIHAHPGTEEDLRASGLKGAFFGIETMNPEAARLVARHGTAPKPAGNSCPDSYTIYGKIRSKHS